MNWVHYLFFNIYSWYYKDGMYNRKINPGLQTITVLVIGTVLWLSLFVQMYFHLIRGSNVILNKSFKFSAIGIILLLMIFYNYYFIRSDRYLKIYDRYMDYSRGNANERRDLFISFMFLLFPFPIMIIYTMLNYFGVLP